MANVGDSLRRLYCLQHRIYNLLVHDHNLTSTAGNFLTTIGVLEDKFAATEGWGHSVPTKFLVSFSIISQNYSGRGWKVGTPGPVASCAATKTCRLKVSLQRLTRILTKRRRHLVGIRTPPLGLVGLILAQLVVGDHGWRRCVVVSGVRHERS